VILGKIDAFLLSMTGGEMWLKIKILGIRTPKM